MHEKLLKSYFWPGLKSDISQFCKSCRVCSLVKPKYINAHLKPYLLDSPMQLIAADYVGLLPVSVGYRYMLVIVDGFSRFPEVYPVRDLSVPTLINSFRDFFSRYGFPDALITDRGTQFQSREFQEYLSRFHIKKLSTTSYISSSNGIASV